MSSAGSWLRFVLAAVLLAGTAFVVQVRGRYERIPARQTLENLPKEFSGYISRDVTIQQDVREVLGDGDFLSRIYGRTPQEPGIELFIAYFASQRTGTAIHSPRNCLPGAGWTPVDAGRVEVPRAGGDAITANRYLIARGLDRKVVVYWYQSNTRAIASEYSAKFYLVADSIRLNRSDGSLVRVITAMAPGESLEQGERRAVAFAQELAPRLTAYIPQ
ncbi:MAG: exosortase C-terminal domain/associated protein EpsI [Terriglobales bacterium]